MKKVIILGTILASTLGGSPVAHAHVTSQEHDNGVVLVNKYRVCKFLLGIPLDVMDGLTDEEFETFRHCTEFFDLNHNQTNSW